MKTYSEVNSPVTSLS